MGELIRGRVWQQYSAVARRQLFGALTERLRRVSAELSSEEIKVCIIRKN